MANSNPFGNAGLDMFGLEKSYIDRAKNIQIAKDGGGGFLGKLLGGLIGLSPPQQPVVGVAPPAETSEAAPVQPPNVGVPPAPSVIRMPQPGVGASPAVGSPSLNDILWSHTNARPY